MMGAWVQLEREEREKKMIPRDGTVKPICADFWLLYSLYTVKVEPVTFFQMCFWQSVDDNVEPLEGFLIEKERSVCYC